MKCPNCHKNTLTNTTLGEVCTNDDCGYVDGMVFDRPKKKKATKKRPASLELALRIIEEQERTIADLQNRLSRERESSCVHCGRGPSHYADGC